jgi:hypothetical protein
VQLKMPIAGPGGLGLLEVEGVVFDDSDSDADDDDDASGLRVMSAVLHVESGPVDITGEFASRSRGGKGGGAGARGPPGGGSPQRGRVIDADFTDKR